jgi:hypothetical protein
VEVLEGAGHRPETEMPDRFVSLLSGFLGEVGDPRLQAQTV